MPYRAFQLRLVGSFNCAVSFNSLSGVETCAIIVGMSLLIYKFNVMPFASVLLFLCCWF